MAARKTFLRELSIGGWRLLFADLIRLPCFKYTRNCQTMNIVHGFQAYPFAFHGIGGFFVLVASRGRLLPPQGTQHFLPCAAVYRQPQARLFGADGVSGFGADEAVCGADVVAACE